MNKASLIVIQTRESFLCGDNNLVISSISFVIYLHVECLFAFKHCCFLLIVILMKWSCMFWTNPFVFNHIFSFIVKCHSLILPLRFHLSYHLYFNQDRKHGILLTFTSLGLSLWEIVKHPLCFVFTFFLVCILTFLTLFKIQKYVLFPFSYCTR